MEFEYFFLDVALWFSIYLIVALSLNLEYGYAGIPNFGRAMAVLIGAAVVGGLVNRILMLFLGINGEIVESSGIVKSTVNTMISQNPAFGIGILLFSFFLAALIGGIAGALFILPSAKLKQEYLTVTLLAISEVLYIVFNYNSSIIGGSYGVSVPDVLACVPREQRFLSFTLLSLGIAFVVYLFVERILTSPYGRLLKAMRENEDCCSGFWQGYSYAQNKNCGFGLSHSSPGRSLIFILQCECHNFHFFQSRMDLFPIPYDSFRRNGK